MKRKRFSVEQIVAVLKQAELGMPVADLIRQVGIPQQTFYRRKKQYAGRAAILVRPAPEPRMLCLGYSEDWGLWVDLLGDVPAGRPAHLLSGKTADWPSRLRRMRRHACQLPLTATLASGCSQAMATVRSSSRNG